MKKIKFSYKDILYKSKRLTVLALILVLSGGMIITSNMEGNDDIPIHDGEVLVDSLAVKEEENIQEENFEAIRAKLELDRNKLISTLDQTINSSDNEAEKDNASKEKERILDYMETELAIERIIESKGLPDALVLITEKSISITVDLQELDTNTVAKICDIAMRETGKSADKIIIQSKY